MAVLSSNINSANWVCEKHKNAVNAVAKDACVYVSLGAGRKSSFK